MPLQSECALDVVVASFGQGVITEEAQPQDWVEHRVSAGPQAGLAAGRGNNGTIVTHFQQRASRRQQRRFSCNSYYFYASCHGLRRVYIGNDLSIPDQQRACRKRQ